MTEHFYYPVTIFLIFILSKILKYYHFKNISNYINIVFYFSWTIVSWFATYMNLYMGKDYYLLAFRHFIIHTINCAYIYELIVNTPDFAHSLHHILTVLLQSFAFYTGFLDKSNHLQLCTTAHSGYFSSIISNLRIIAIKENWKSKTVIVNTYYYSYLISKFSGIIMYYYILYKYHIQFLGYPNFIVIILYFMVHLVQLYFSKIIIKKILK